MASEPVVVCGKKTIRWNNLHSGIVKAADYSNNRNNSAYADVLTSVLAAESLWIDLYFKKFKPGGKMDWEANARTKLVGMLNMVRVRQATKPIDKVFALYGVLKALEIINNEDFVDYKKTDSEAYLEFTRTIIDWH